MADTLRLDSSSVLRAAAHHQSRPAGRSSVEALQFNGMTCTPVHFLKFLIILDCDFLRFALDNLAGSHCSYPIVCLISH